MSRREGHIRQRSPGSYELRYSIGTDPLTGRRKLVTVTVRAQKKKEAQEALTKRLHERDVGQHVDPSRVTVAEYIREWLGTEVVIGSKGKPLSGKTLERYRQLAEQQIIPHLGPQPLQKLRPAHVQDWHTKLLQQGGKGGSPLAARTVGHAHRLLHEALARATKAERVSRNVAAAVSPPTVEGDEIEVLQPADVDLIRASLKGRSIYPIVMTALGTGMRRGELLALRWQDVELEQGFLRVERSVEQTKAGLRFKPPKTKNGRRTITLPAFVITELRAHWKAQQETRLKLGLGKAPPDSLVFARFDGEPRSPNRFSQEWAECAETLGLNVTFHALRHTHASQLIAARLDVLTVSRRLGHGSPTITLAVYGHLFKNTDGGAAQALELAYGGAD